VIGTLPFDLTETLEQVLSEPRFQAPSESWWDRFLERLLAEAARLLAAVIDAVGGPVVAAFLALAVVAAVTLLVTLRLAGRRAAVIEDRLVLDRLLEMGANPQAYLDAAEDASRRGEHSRAIRLRFVGEVLDFGRRGRIRYEPGLTTAGIASQIDDDAFDELAAQFDRVAYGGLDAGPNDDEWSRRRWQEIRTPV